MSHVIVTFMCLVTKPDYKCVTVWSFLMCIQRKYCSYNTEQDFSLLYRNMYCIGRKAYRPSSSPFTSVSFGAQKIKN